MYELLRLISIFRYFLLFLVQTKASSYNLVDECILLFKQEGCKVMATWHRRRNNFCRVDMEFYALINYFKKLVLHLLFTVPHKVVFKFFFKFLGTTNWRNNSLSVRTISMAYTIPCQRFFVPNLIVFGVLLKQAEK